MSMLTKRLKGIPVWVIAIVLVSGTVLGAGIWFLSVDGPVEYDEPLQVSYTGEDEIYEVEDLNDEWIDIGIGDYRDTYDNTKPAILNYGEFAHYIRVENPREDEEAEVQIEIWSEYDGDETNDDIQFVVEEGLHDPWDLDSDYEDDAEVEATETLDIGPEDEVYLTVMSVIEDPENPPWEDDETDIEDYNLAWRFTETDLDG